MAADETDETIDGLAVERVKGIEPSYAAWEAAVLPLNYTRAERCLHQARLAVQIHGGDIIHGGC
jgi:hypothetical protein